MGDAVCIVIVQYCIVLYGVLFCPVLDVDVDWGSDRSGERRCGISSSVCLWCGSVSRQGLWTVLNGKRRVLGMLRIRRRPGCEVGRVNGGR